MNTQHTEECAESIPWYSRSLDFEQLQRDYPPPPDYFRTTYRMPRDALRALQEKRFLATVKRGWLAAKTFIRRHLDGEIAGI